MLSVAADVLVVTRCCLLQLMSIRIGSLPGSAVDEFLKRLQSKLVDVSSRHPVPKTDEGIDWVM